MVLTLTDLQAAHPPTWSLFEPVRDVYGDRLALVFGNEFTAGRCPFYEKQCFHCDVGAGEGQQFNPALNEQRLDFLAAYYREILKSVVHLVIYNSGSTLNPRELSRESLGQILRFVASLEAVKVVSLDSRELYITAEALGFILAYLRADQFPRVILGLESQSDEIRLGKLRKMMTRRGIERAFETVGGCGGKVGLDINIVFQPPGVVGQAAVAEAIATAAYALELGGKYNVAVDFNFHPYYPSQIGLKHFPDHPRADVAEAVQALLGINAVINRTASAAQVFVGWQDEFHDQQPEVRQDELGQYQTRFHRFNITQDISVLSS